MTRQILEGVENETISLLLTLTTFEPDKGRLSFGFSYLYPFSFGHFLE